VASKFNGFLKLDLKGEASPEIKFKGHETPLNQKKGA
jgi:hypothetical protein